MSVYKLPKRGHYGFTGNKPVHAEIDHKSGFTKDLACVHLLHDYNDIVSGYSAEPSTTIPTSRYHHQHKTGRIFNADNHINLGKPLNQSGPFSYLVVFRNEVLDFTSNNILVGYGDRATFRQYYNQLQFFTYNGSGWDSFTSSNTYSQYDYVVAIATHTGSTNNIYFNGTKSSAACSARSYGTHLDLWLGSETENPTRLFTGDIFYSAIWNRALSDEEAHFLTRNPYHFLKPKFERQYIKQASGGGGGPTLPIFHNYYRSLKAR